MIKKKPDLEALKQFVKEHPFPTDLLVETTAYCNLACIMCPQEKLTRPKGTMTFALWKKIVDEVAEKYPKTIIWPALMGEPLLDKGIFQKVEYASNKGIHIALNSNLNAFKKEMTDDLFNSKVPEIIVGMDGFKPETYEKVRVNGDHKKMMNALSHIIEEKKKRNLDYPKITLQYIVMDENEDEVEDFVSYWEKSGKKVTLKIKPRTGWADGVGAWTNIINVNQEERNLPCTWLIRQMTVFWNGQVPQCDGDWDGKTSFGNVNENSLEEIWTGALKKIRDRHMNLSFKFSPCDVCEDWQAGMSDKIECGT